MRKHLSSTLSCTWLRPSSLSSRRLYFTQTHVVLCKTADVVSPQDAAPARCALCDVRWEDEPWLVSTSTGDGDHAHGMGATPPPPLRQWWAAHCASPTHTARDAICEQFLARDRSEFILKHMQQHLRVDVNTLDDVEVQRVARRRRRLASSLVHLRDKQAVHQYTPRTSLAPSTDASSFTVGARAEGSATSSAPPSTSSTSLPDTGPLVSDAFLNHMLAGAALARVEVMDRVARLMPRSSATALSSITAYVLSTRQLGQLYDDLQFNTLVAHVARAEAPPSAAVPRFTPREKAIVMYSCLGELSLFSRQDRPRGVVDKSAADTLVLHVLASHALDGILADLVHGTLQRVVDEGMPVFEQYKVQMNTQRAA